MGIYGSKQNHCEEVVEVSCSSGEKVESEAANQDSPIPGSTAAESCESDACNTLQAQKLYIGDFSPVTRPPNSSSVAEHLASGVSLKEKDGSCASVNEDGLEWLERDGFVFVDTTGLAEAFKAFTEEEVRRSEQEMRDKNIKSEHYWSGKLSEWMHHSLDIAIISEDTSEMSSFVNCIRGVSANDPKFGVPVKLPKTTDPVPYADPNNANLRFWDLPSFNSTDQKLDAYLTKVNFERFDFILMVSSSTFSAVDLRVAEELIRAGKKIFFVRCRIQNELNDAATRECRPSAVDCARESISRELSEQRLQNPSVFIIDSSCKWKWDFPKLCHALCIECPEWKREAMVLSVRAFSKELMREKVRVLQGRIKWVAAGAGTGALIPLPGAAFPIGIAIVVREYLFYRWHLNLDDVLLSELEDRLSDENKPVFCELKKIPLMNLTTSEAMSYFLTECVTAAAFEGVSEVAKLYSVGLTSIFSCVVSYAFTYQRLLGVLSELECISDKLHGLLLPEPH